MTISSVGTRIPPHLSAELVALLRSLLLCQVAESADQAAGCRVTVDDLTGQPDTDSLLERELAEASATHFDAIVVEARDALRRLDDGSYGSCQTCGMPIPFERLEAMPHTRRCVACPGAPVSLLG